MFSNIWSTGLTTDGALSIEAILRERNELLRRIQEVQQLPATQGTVLGWEERDGQRYLVSYFGGERATQRAIRRALAGDEGATIEMGDVEEAIAEVVAEEQAIRKPTT
jgi:hypothetical protein